MSSKETVQQWNLAKIQYRASLANQMAAFDSNPESNFTYTYFGEFAKVTVFLAIAHIIEF